MRNKGERDMKIQSVIVVRESREIILYRKRVRESVCVREREREKERETMSGSEEGD